MLKVSTDVHLVNSQLTAERIWLCTASVAKAHEALVKAWWESLGTGTVSAQATRLQSGVTCSSSRLFIKDQEDLVFGWTMATVMESQKVC